MVRQREKTDKRTHIQTPVPPRNSLHHNTCSCPCVHVCGGVEVFLEMFVLCEVVVVLVVWRGNLGVEGGTVNQQTKKR